MRRFNTAKISTLSQFKSCGVILPVSILSWGLDCEVIKITLQKILRCSLQDEIKGHYMITGIYTKK